MGFLDGLLGQVASNVDVAGLAAKVGITPEQAENAVAALAQAHTAPGDTVQTASNATGLPSDTLQQIISHIGGEGSLGRFASLLADHGAGAGGILGQVEAMVDQNGNGPADEIASFAKGLFGKR
jgi:hypothetical protein